MDFFGKHRLVPHPCYPPKDVQSVEVEVRPAANGSLFLCYAVAPAQNLRLLDYGPQRRDGLWNGTCFELFMRGGQGDKAYREFNFAPFAAWTAYTFVDWRRGMRPLELVAEPHLVDMRLDDRRGNFPDRYELDVMLPAEALGGASRRASLTAVIEETDGTKSYWALSHASGDADFHDAACFTLELLPDACQSSPRT